MTTTAAPRYTPGQSVEVLVNDFDTPGFPEVWTAGTVASVERREDGLADVMVRLGPARWSPQLVGKRGGNQRIREVPV